MSVLPDKLLTPEEEELRRKRATLAGLEAQLADRELELAAFLADLVHFEKRYLQTVGRRHALLDELKARIAGARAVERIPTRQAPLRPVRWAQAPAECEAAASLR